MLPKDTNRRLIDFAFSAVREMPVLSNNPEGLVYHFTNESGLRGIVENSKLWATRAVCLNDAEEVKYGLSLMETILSSRFNNGNDISGVALGHLSAPKPDLVIDPFVVSFCMRESNSGQWKHYGRQGHGYSIGFEPRGIMRPGLTTLRVLYDKSEQVRVLNSLIASAESEAVSFIRELSPDDREEGKGVAGVSLYAVLRALAPCFKHVSFSVEEEWRVVDYHIESEWIDARHGKNPKLRPSNDRIIQFIELLLPSGNESPIREIVIGHNVEEAVARESINVLLRTAGLSLDRVRIRRSEVALKEDGKAVQGH